MPDSDGLTRQNACQMDTTKRASKAEAAYCRHSERAKEQQLVPKAVHLARRVEPQVVARRVPIQATNRPPPRRKRLAGARVPSHRSRPHTVTFTQTEWRNVTSAIADLEPSRFWVRDGTVRPYRSEFSRT